LGREGCPTNKLKREKEAGRERCGRGYLRPKPTKKGGRKERKTLSLFRACSVKRDV
jgi:hypothetical protein